MSNRAMVPLLVTMMLVTGVCNTLLTKYQDMQCVRDCDTDRPKMFEQPVIQTLQMFVGESGCWIVVFVGYLYRLLRNSDGTTPNGEVAYESVRASDTMDDGSDAENDDDDDDDGEVNTALTSSQTLVDPTNIIAKPVFDAEHRQRVPLQGWKVVLLAAPAICDICGTTLMNVGLLFVAASIYQMTRGALVLFVGLLSVLFLKRHLGGWKWASLFIVVLGVAVVGLAGVLDQQHSAQPQPGATDTGSKNDLAKTALRIRGAASTLEAHTARETLIGFVLIACAQIFTATQFVVEESIMERYSMDPIRVVGWEGVFGFLVTLLGMGILHALVGRTDAGRGGYFDAREGFYEVFHYRAIGLTSILIMISIGGFNFFGKQEASEHTKCAPRTDVFTGLSVTRVISATSRSTIDTCRTLFIWLVSLGLGWETCESCQVWRGVFVSGHAC